MVAKAKTKPKPVKRASKPVKSTKLKAKPAKPVAKKTVSKSAKASKKSIKTSAKSLKPSKPAARKTPAKATPKPESRKTVAPPAKVQAAPPQRARSKHFGNALQAYEAGIKLMHAEDYQKAIKTFEELIAEHVEEPEIQERAKVLIHACEKRIQEKARTVLRSADDHYNIGIADLNRRELDSALHHLQQALKLAPKADHILYALAAASALQGNRDQALAFLKQSIQHRPENRFFAARDEDFNTLTEDSDFRLLVTPPEK